MAPIAVFTIIMLVFTLTHNRSVADYNFTEYLLDGNIFDCLLGWTFGEAPTDAVVDVYLIKPGNEKSIGRHPNLEKIWFSKSLINMKSKYFNHNLPFKIFMNGFNLLGQVNSTWMYSVAQNLVHHHQLNGISLNKYNYVIIFWHIPGLSTDDVVESLIFYHRTLSKYKQVVAKSAAIIDRMIQAQERKLIESKNNTKLERYFNQFQFYGHSLGAQIVFHVAKVLQMKKPYIKFGKIVGLDPSLLCFKPGEHGINGIEGKNYAHEVVVVHSSTGLVGVQESPGTSEIVLNGGTFQPNCSMTEISCHHSRSWGILNYYDDSCQMVAYTCKNLDEFKHGYCFHQDLPLRFSNLQFKLVNLPEQHFSKPYHLIGVDSLLNEGYGIVNELEPALSELTSSYLNRTAEVQLDEQSKRFYYVNTAPSRHDAGKSHCLQHYQAKLVILNQASTMNSKCKITSFIQSRSDQLTVSFNYLVFNEECSSECQLTNIPRREKQRRFAELIPGKLFTSLINYSGQPKVYTSAMIENIDLKAWAECLSNKKIHGNFTFILDVSFMSNISARIRKVFSTVLCGKWNPRSSSPQLKLTLCNRSRLMDSEEYTSSSLILGNQQRQDPWYIQLLNGLSHAIINWDPLIQ